MKYLPLYYKWMETNRMPCAGLCNSIGRKEVDLFRPTVDDTKWLLDNGFPIYAWGCLDATRDVYEFNTFRQNIVLLLAALNNEL